MRKSYSLQNRESSILLKDLYNIILTVNDYPLDSSTAERGKRCHQCIEIRLTAQTHKVVSDVYEMLQILYTSFAMPHICHRKDIDKRVKMDHFNMFRHSWISVKRFRFPWYVHEITKRNKFSIQFPDILMREWISWHLPDILCFPDMADTLGYHWWSTSAAQAILTLIKISLAPNGLSCS